MGFLPHCFGVLHRNPLLIKPLQTPLGPLGGHGKGVWIDPRSSPRTRSLEKDLLLIEFTLDLRHQHDRREDVQRFGTVYETHGLLHLSGGTLGTFYHSIANQSRNYGVCLCVGTMRTLCSLLAHWLELQPRAALY